MKSPEPETNVRSSQREERRSRELREARFVAREAGGAWLAQVLHGGLRYVGAFFAARILGVSAFGAYTLALAVTGIGTAASDLGLSPGVLPFLSRARQAGDAARIRALLRAALVLVAGAGTGVAVLAFLAAPWLGGRVFDDPGFPPVLRALAPLILLGAIVGLLATFLQGFLAIKERAWIEKVLVTGVTVAVLAGAWALGWGWPGVVAAMLLGPATGIVSAVVLLRRLVPESVQVPTSADAPPTRGLLAYSWPLLGSSMLVFLLLWSDVLLMGVFREADEVGVYGLCARLAGGVLLVQESIGQAFVPRLSDQFAAGDRDGMRHLYHLSTRWAVWPTVIAAAVLAVWGGPILAVFAPGFSAGAAPLAILALAKAIGVASGMSGKVFAVTGHARITLVNLILAVACNVALNLVWIPRYGATGAAAATLVSIAGINALQLIQVRAYLRLLPWDRKILWPLVGVPLLAVLGLPFREGPAVPLGWLVPLAGFAAACVVLYVARGVDTEEREVWRTIGNRLGLGGHP